MGDTFPEETYQDPFEFQEDRGVVYQEITPLAELIVYPTLFHDEIFSEASQNNSKVHKRRTSASRAQKNSFQAFPSQMNLIYKSEGSQDITTEETGSNPFEQQNLKKSINNTTSPEGRKFTGSKQQQESIVQVVSKNIGFEDSKVEFQQLSSIDPPESSSNQNQTNRLSNEINLLKQQQKMAGENSKIFKNQIAQQSELKNMGQEGQQEPQLIYKQKTFAEQVLGKLQKIINGSEDSTFAKEDEDLRNQIIDLEATFQTQKANKLSNNTQKQRKSIQLFSWIKPIKVSSEKIPSLKDFDQIINQNNQENVGTKRRTYTEFNTLMKQQTLEFEQGKKLLEESCKERENEEEDSDVDSQKENKMIAQAEELKKKSDKRKKYRKIKKIQLPLTSDSRIETKESPKKQNGPQKFEYPFPYNMTIQQKEEEDQFRLVDEDLKEEYEFYSKKQEIKQEKNREQVIFAVYKNEFERIALNADNYPLLQVRKIILLILKLFSWLALKIIKHRYFERFVLFVIIFNTIMQCQDDPTTTTTTPAVDAINFFFLVSYTSECALKILGLGFIFNEGAYLRDGWNCLDFLIVVTSLLPYFLGSSSVNLSSLRSLRVLRPLKTISKIKSLKIVLLALFSSFPYLVNALIILVFFYLIFAIAGLQLFMGLFKKRCFDPTTGIILAGTNDQPCGGLYVCPDNYVCGKMFDNPIYGVFNFDTIVSSFLMVFICVTLESWTQIMYYVFDSFTAISVIYFVTVAFVGAFFLINLTLAVIKAKFTQPEDFVESGTNRTLKDCIDMHSLKMFRRMERNHLRRKLFSKKDALKVGANELNFTEDRGLYFNWEDLMKLKKLQDKEDEQTAQIVKEEQMLEEQTFVKEKLKEKLKKAISKDTFFRKCRQEKQTREIPHQKIVFYISKNQKNDGFSSACFQEAMMTPSRKRRASYINKQQNRSPSSFHNLQIEKSPKSRLDKQTSIKISEFGKFYNNQTPKYNHVQDKYKGFQKIQFLGLSKEGISSPYRGETPTYRSKNKSSCPGSPSNISSFSNFKGFGRNTFREEDCDEDNDEIFERFDQINKMEKEELKKLESNDGPIDADSFQVVNNQNLKKLRKLPDVRVQLSIMALKGGGQFSHKQEPNSQNYHVKQLFLEDQKLNKIDTNDCNSKEATKSTVAKSQQYQNCEEIYPTKEKPNSFINLPMNGEEVTFAPFHKEPSLFSLPSGNDEEFPNCKQKSCEFQKIQSDTCLDEHETKQNYFQNYSHTPNHRIKNRGMVIRKQSTFDFYSEERKVAENNYILPQKKPLFIPQIQLKGLDRKSSLKNVESNINAIYDEDDDEEDNWMEEKLTARPSVILKNINSTHLNSVANKHLEKGIIDPKRQDESSPRTPQQSNIGKIGSILQIKLGKQGTQNIDEEQTQIHEQQYVPQQLKRIQTYKRALSTTKSKNLQCHLNLHSEQNPISVIGGIKKTIKPKHNVRHWKIMVDMKKEFKSNSSSDILFHRLKAQQDKKIEEEQIKISEMKYSLAYRLRINNASTFKSKNKTVKVKKEKKVNSALSRGNENDGLPKSKKSSRATSKSVIEEGSLCKSIEIIKDDFSQQKYFCNLPNSVRFPIKRNSFLNHLSQSQFNNNDNNNNNDNGNDEMNMHQYFQNNFQSSPIQCVSSLYNSLKEQQLRSKFKVKLARAAQSKEKIVFNLQNIKSLIGEEINKTAIQTSLDGVSNKSAYWDFRRLDYTQGVKRFAIWSGSNVQSQNKRKNYQENKILMMLSTYTQDLQVFIPGIKGFIYVIHKHFKKFVLGSVFNTGSMMAVFLNTAVLAMNGSFQSQSFNDLLTQFNYAFSLIFIVEMGMKILALGPIGYIRDKINIFDGAIVGISIVEMVMFSGGSKAVSAFRAVRIFRTFRVLRVTRLLRSLKFMSTIMSVINRTIDSFMYIALLLFLFIFIYSLLGMQMYGGQLSYQDKGGIRQNYDNFFNAFLATFQIVTLENWPDILVTTMRSSISPIITGIYLISWIFIGNYVFLNLFLAILLDGFVAEGEGEEKGQIEDDNGEDSDLDEQIQVNILKMTKAQILEEKKKLLQDEEIRVSKQLQNQQDLDSETNLEKILEDKKDKDINLFQGIECLNSLYIFSKKSKLRIFCYKIAQSHRFENFILFLIVSSSLKLVVDTYIHDSQVTATQVSSNLDFIFNSIFMMESLIKIISYGFIGDNNSYLTDTWSQLDFFIVLASLMDMSISQINLPVIKILRLLRTLRPLRFISHNVNMKVVVIALFESVGAIANVLVVVLLIWLMFGILGMSLIGGRMGYCDTTNYFGINQTICTSMGKNWKTFPTNFDNISNSMITLLILSTLENWPNIMFQAQDSNTSDQGPQYMNYNIISLFYIVFILIGSFFLINLFIGVIFLKFTEAQKSQKISIFLTDKQARWIEFQMMIIGVQAQFQQNKKPESSFKLFFWNIVNHKAFDITIMVAIIANIFSMGMTYETQTNSWDSLLSKINYFFTSVFFTEMVLKMLSTGVSIYLSNAWNKFDFFVVCSSLIDISMELMGGQSLSFLRMGPQLARVIRVFRVTRLLKLVKSMRGLQKLIETLLFSLPSLVNVGALMLLFFFIFSILGVFLFKDIVSGTAITSYNNFQNFGNAMITLFRCSTGENWQQIMFDVGDSSNCSVGGICYTQFAEIYFIFFILICVFVMLNLFILVLIQYFEDYHMKEDNPLDAFNENLEIFRSVWAKYTSFSSGVKISHKHIVNFLSELPTPLGYFEANIEDQGDFESRLDKHQIAKDVMEMKLQDDGQGNVFFNDCLFACMKKAYGAELVNEDAVELKRFLIKQEYETKKKIEEKKRQMLIKQKRKIFNADKNQHINPIVLMLFCGMAFKSWRNYIETLRQENGQINKEQSPFSPSASEDDDSSKQDYMSDDSDEEEDDEEQEEQQLEDIFEQQEEEEDEEDKDNISNEEQEAIKVNEGNKDPLQIKSIAEINKIKDEDDSEDDDSEDGSEKSGEDKQIKIKKRRQKKLERGGYDEDETFQEREKREMKWKEQEIKQQIQSIKMEEKDQDLKVDFFKIPKNFLTEEQDKVTNNIDEESTPVAFKSHNKANKHQNNPSFTPLS